MSPTHGPTTARHLWPAALFVFLAAVAVVAVYTHRAPAMVPADAAPTVFSAERAFAHVEAIAQEPHAAGSPANARVVDYLIDTIRAMGVEPQVQETVVNWAPGRAATVRNVLARLPGTAHTRAVALMAHHDSVPYGPGAADDGSGVAALLETLRALKAAPRLRNDVLFVFTDGEEGNRPLLGRRGAYAFARQHPWVADIGVLLNFDARGTWGPSYMYETSAQNGWLIEQMARAGCRPVANSIMGGLSRRMPTGSDFTMLTDVGVDGLNFAFVGGLAQYHTRMDRPDNLDLRSLQHHGLYAWRLAQHFGDLDLGDIRKPDAVFFNPIGAVLVRYPRAFALTLTITAVLLTAAVLALGLRRKRLAPSSVVKGFAAFGASALAALALAALAVIIAYRVKGVYLVYSSAAFMAAFVLVAVALVAALVAMFARRQRTNDLAAAVLLWWALVDLVVTVFAPDAAYFFTWPLLASALGFACLMAVPPRRPAIACIVLAVSAVPGVLFGAQMLWSMYLAGTALFSPPVIALLALFLGLLAPHIALLAPERRWWLPLTAANAAAVLLVLAFMGGGFTPQHPKVNFVSYALDADTHQACWLSDDARTDRWTGQFFPPGTPRKNINDFLPPDTKAYLRAPAPVVPLEAPTVELVGESIVEGGRQLRLHLRSPRRAARMMVYPDPQTHVRDAAVNGTTLQEVPGPWFLSYDILPPEGIELALTVDASAPARFKVVDRSHQLPELPDAPIEPRPDHMMVKPNTLDFNRSLLKSDETLVAKTFVF